MHLARLTHLLEVLEAVPEKQFDWGHWGTHQGQDHEPSHCGTTACVMGWAALDPIFEAEGLEHFWEQSDEDMNRKFLVVRFGNDPVYNAEVACKNFFELTQEQTYDLCYGKGGLQNAIKLVKEFILLAKRFH